MTLFDAIVFLMVYAVVFLPGYFWLMPRHDKKIEAKWAEQRKRMQAI